MGVIQTHGITLSCADDRHTIVLRPLCDAHLPHLYRWNADPEVVYWADTGNVDAFEEEDVRGMYASVSRHTLCFLVEVDGAPIGDCWLQEMNLTEVSAQYPGLDVRRIDMTIGEKSLWGQKIGTSVIEALIEYAFQALTVDVLYCFIADYNIRSQKLLLRQGFTRCGEDVLGDESLRAKKEYHYVLTREQYSAR